VLASNASVLIGSLDKWLKHRIILTAVQRRFGEY
jgi:hypothetical protein